MIKKFLPILTWLPNYRRKHLQGDLSAGLTVGVMLIPQGMAYAMLAGLPPIYGFYASIIPLLLYAVFGTSRQLAVGPIAMVSILVSSGLSPMAEPGSAAYIGLAILVALLVGLFQLGLGLLRLGFLVNFLSRPVIKGFTSAAAFIIGLSQLKNLMGVSIPRSEKVHEVFLNALDKVPETHVPTLVLGLLGIGLILLLRKIHRAIPGPLVVVVAGILAVYLGGLAEGGMAIVGEVPSGFRSPELPALSMEAVGDLWPVVLTISLVGFMSSYAVAKTMQSRHKDYEIDANQELVALGISNIGGSIFGSYPVTGGFARSAVNDQFGAKTTLASIITAGFIALALVFLTPLFYYLPKAILASIIMVAVINLVDIKEAVHLWKSDRVDFLMMLATFLATLVLGIQQGIGIGVGLSLLVVIYRSAYPHFAVLGQLPGTSYYRNLDRFSEAEDRSDILILRFDAQLYFANTNYFRTHLEQLVQAKGEALELVVLNAESITYMDSTAVNAMRDQIRNLQQQGVALYMAGVMGPVRDILYKSRLLEELGQQSQFLHVHEAIAYWDRKKESQEKSQPVRHRHAYQTNYPQDGEG